MSKIKKTLSSDTIQESEGDPSGGDITTPDTGTSKQDSGTEKVHITETPLIKILEAKPSIDETANTPVLQSIQADSVEGIDSKVFEEIPEEVCGQLYATTLEIGFTLKHKDMALKSIPPERVKTQGAIIYGILLKNQISIKHIDIFMLGMGMVADWKFLCSDMNPRKPDKVTHEE